MKKVLLCSLIYLICFSGFSQNREVTINEYFERYPHAKLYQGVYRYTPTLLPTFDLQPILLDDSKLKITYDVSVEIDTTTQVKYHDRMIVLLGDKWEKSFGEGMWIENMSRTAYHNRSDHTIYDLAPGMSKVLNFAVYRDKTNGVIINRAIFPEKRGFIYRYDEEQPIFKWVLTDECKDSNGYICQKALTSFAGREWVVWFSTEVPIDCGLWKFKGLPGLIIEAYDSDREYEFSLRTLEKTKEPIVKYKIREKKLKRENFKKMEMNLHEKPILYSKGASGYKAFISKERSLGLKTIFDMNNFTYPYNPMEKE